MFLKKLLRAIFGAKKKDVVALKKPYTLTYSDKEIRFFTPKGLEWARKMANTLHPWAIEERKEVHHLCTKEKIHELIETLYYADGLTEPCFLN